VSAPPFSHEALLYAGEDEFLEGTIPFVREGVDAGEPVLLALSAPRLERIEDELDGDREAVFLADLSDVGANPARIIPAWRRFAEEHSTSELPVRGIGEPIWPGRTPDELVEAQRHESLLSLAFADGPPFRLLCTYDTRALGDDVIAEALRTHPCVVENGVRRRSGAYRGPRRAAELFADPLPAPPASVRELRFDLESLARVRRLVSRRTAKAGLDPARANDFVVAVNEVATNSVRHGGGTGTLRLWMGTRWLVCEIEDSGEIDDPLAGRQEPTAEQLDGRGLWIANQVCDLVQVRSVPAGTVVRMHLERAGLAQPAPTD
jgi:anti-sigma regulatory factor (Ser/Thr protein kinase)